MNEALSIGREFIMPNLTSGVMETWRLEEAVSLMQTTLHKVHALIDRAEWWRFKNEHVAKLLAQLKDAAYDAGDLLGTFDYHGLVRKIEGSQGQASQLMVRTSSFFARILSGDADKVKCIQGRLDHCSTELMRVLGMLDSTTETVHYRKSVIGPVTSSFVTEPEVVGRKIEHSHLIDLLNQSHKGSESSDGLLNQSHKGSEPSDGSVRKPRVETLTIIPIVGVGGVGKTSLAQEVYNDVRTKELFDQRIWVCVSDIFDVVRITKEIIECFNRGKQCNLTNLSFMQDLLKDKLFLCKFLLVLDNVWNKNVIEWEILLAPLRPAVTGSVILVTTRSLEVAKIVGTTRPVALDGIQEDHYWDFFKRCAFRSVDSSNHPELQSIAMKIASKLKGSPLAAKNVGGLLWSKMDERHWRTIMNSELWELKQGENENGILPALHLSYLYLPRQMKQCFSFCSILPKDHDLLKDDLVDLWVAQGFITDQGSKTVEDVGYEYFDEFVRLSFFQNSPRAKQHFVIHDLMHDLAQSVSLEECFRLHDLKNKHKIPTTVRHMSVCVNNTEQFMELNELCNYTKLRTLLVFISCDFDLGSVIKCWLTNLKNIRCLKVIGGSIKELPESVGGLEHLRFLELSNCDITKLPKSLFCLYNLQFIHLHNQSTANMLDSHVAKGLAKLVNLRKLRPVELITSGSVEIGKLNCLQSLPQFNVPIDHGYRIRELRNITQLHGTLWLKNLENVRNKEDAVQAMLINKEFLFELILEWSANRPYSQADDSVLDGLQPPSNIKMLELVCYGGNRAPNWLERQTLPYLTSLVLKRCLNLTEIPLLPPYLQKLQFEHVGLVSLPRIWDKLPDSMLKGSILSKLYIEHCPCLRSLQGWLIPQLLPVITTIHIRDCGELLSLPVETFKDFVSLTSLVIQNCPRIICQTRFLFPPSIKKLEIESCGNLDSYLPNCLTNLNHLTNMRLSRCLHVSALPSDVMKKMASLRCFTLNDCQNLISLEGLQDLPTLENLCIVKCTRLRAAIPIKLGNQIQEKCGFLKYLSIDNTALLNLPFLRNPPSSLVRLEICDSLETSMFCGDQLTYWLRGTRSLTKLHIRRCVNLKTLPELRSLTSLRMLSIIECPNISTGPLNGFPSSILKLEHNNCSISLTAELEQERTRKPTSDNGFLPF